MRELARTVAARLTSPVTLVVGGAVALVLALAGPFGTYDMMPGVERLGYWGLIVFVSIPFGHLTRHAVARWTPRVSVVTVVVLPALLMTLLFTPVLYVIVRYVGRAWGEPLTLYLWLMWLVLVVALCINAVRWVLGQTAAEEIRRARESARRLAPQGPPDAGSLAVAVPGAVPAGIAGAGAVVPGTVPTGHAGGLVPGGIGAGRPDAVTPRIVARLAGLTSTEVLRLTARDHYVDVITRGGQTSLLMRLSDAMAEMEGIPGAQVHRSHWVATAAVERARREGGRIVLDLADGSRVPVSRGYRERAGAAGLLKGLRTEDLSPGDLAPVGFQPG